METLNQPPWFLKSIYVKLQITSKTARNVKLNAEKTAIYFLAPPGTALQYCLNVIRLASDAIRVPVPPIFTPRSKFL